MNEPGQRAPIRLVVLDRDGVLNVNRDDYVKSPDELVLIPGAAAAVARLNAAGFATAIATNQSCIGRGIITEGDLAMIHGKLVRALAAAGGHVDQIYVAPDAPHTLSNRRKPGPGMLIDAMVATGIGPEGTLFIGDAATDAEAAAAAGVGFVLVRTGHGASTERKLRDGRARWVADDLSAAVDRILAMDPSPAASIARHGVVCPGGLSAIGGTPLIALDRVHPGPGRLLAKAEFLQPGGSIKDRAARQILLGARAQGALAPGQSVVEMTSGNMGAGLAVVCAVLGHPLVVTMSAGNSPARARMLEALGAEVILVPQVDGAPGQVTGADIGAATQEAKRIATTRGAYYVDQFNNPDGVRAHQDGTGPEIWTQAGGRLDAFVASVGSAGTFVGVARYLKARAPAIRCVAVEPEGCEPLAGRPVTKARHLLQGTGYGAIPGNWEPGLMDYTLSVGDDEATRWRHDLAVREGLYVGYSAAANVAAASRLLTSGVLGPHARVATILCDTGLKY